LHFINFHTDDSETDLGKTY